MKETLTPIPDHTHEVIKQIDHEGVRRSVIDGLVSLELISNHEEHGAEGFEPGFLGDSPRV